MDAAELLLEADEVDTALDILESTAKDNYVVENLHYLRAAIYLGRGQHSKAKEAALVEVANFPQNKNAWDILHNYEFSYRCPVCRNEVEDYSPLSQEYISKLNENEFPYSLEDFATLNYKKYICPSCGANDRDRLIALYINEISQANPIGNRLNLLDFAPSQSFTNYINWNNNFNHKKVDFLLNNYDEIVDIQNMAKYQDGNFDAIICSHVLEHVEDDRKALSEIRRVLKKDGWALILSPICLSLKVVLEDPSVVNPHERWKYFGQDDHVRLYSKSGFKDRINQAGFSITELSIEHFGIEKFVSSGLNSRSILYVAR
jgi:SAM-dependent methyltransferase